MSRKRPSTTSARYRGECAMCGKPWNVGDSIRNGGLGWGHSRCVTREERSLAKVRQLDQEADHGNTRRWQTHLSGG